MCPLVVSREKHVIFIQGVMEPRGAGFYYELRPRN